VYRGITTYLILVVSKFVMLEAINLAFGARVQFVGRWHGLVPFVAVIIAIIVAEAIMTVSYKRIGGRVEG
jgi:NADH:ubiquinone oxidoreductase subunit K